MGKCYREQFDKFISLVEEAERNAREEKCNYVIYSIGRRRAYQKEQCWIDEGRPGTLIRIVRYGDNVL